MTILTRIARKKTEKVKKWLFPADMSGQLDQKKRRFKGFETLHKYGMHNLALPLGFIS
jgi:hypothetical protein